MAWVCRTNKRTARFNYLWSGFNFLTKYSSDAASHPAELSSCDSDALGSLSGTQKPRHLLAGGRGGSVEAALRPMGFHLRRASTEDLPQLLALAPAALPEDVLRSAETGAILLAVSSNQSIRGLARTVRATSAVELVDLAPQLVVNESKTVLVDVIAVDRRIRAELWSALLLISKADPSVESVVSIVDRSDTELFQAHARAGAGVLGVVPTSRTASPWRGQVQGPEGLLLRYELRHDASLVLGSTSKPAPRVESAGHATALSGADEQQTEATVKAAIESLALPGVAGSLTNETMRLGFMELGLDSDDVTQLVSRLNAKLPFRVRILERRSCSASLTPSKSRSVTDSRHPLTVRVRRLPLTALGYGGLRAAVPLGAHKPHPLHAPPRARCTKAAGTTRAVSESPP